MEPSWGFRALRLQTQRLDVNSEMSGLGAKFYRDHHVATRSAEAWTQCDKRKPKCKTRNLNVCLTPVEEVRPDMVIK